MFKKFLHAILILIFLLSPIASPFVDAEFYVAFSPVNESMVISENTTWKKDDNLVFDKIISITSGATLTIEKGANIVFAGPNPLAGIKVLDGNIIASGETNNKIIFSAKPNINFNISIKSKNKKSFFRYVAIDGGGNNSFYQVKIPTRKSFFNKAYAQFNNNQGSGLASLQVDGGKIKIENSEFINSVGGDVKIGAGTINDKDNVFESAYLPKVEIINTNFSHQQAVSARQCLEYKMLENKSYNNCKNLVYLKNNWYGSEYGPEDDESFKLLGDYTLDGFKKNKMIVDPVILIPGILGSAFTTKGNLEIDPIWHKYDDLIESFKKNGFTENKNLFLFPYDWRWSNSKTAILLKYKIKQVKEKTKISKVDIVAHSMGGLVARAYAEKENYADNIDQLIFLGTPQKGAPEAYLKWEAGEGFFSVLDWLLKSHLNHEAKEKGYDDLGKYIREKVLSVQDLLPDYDYLFDVKEDKIRSYSDNYPRNKFLENLNLKESVNKLEKLNIVNFIGNLGKKNTISEIKVTNKEFIDKWEDGYPENFDDKKTDMGLIKDFGDGTVPLISAKAISADDEKEFDVAHTDLPTKTQCEIIKELTDDFVDENLDEEDQGCKYVDNWDLIKTNWILFQVFSPIDIQIIAPDGKRAGKNFATGGYYNEIKGAYYTGYKTDTEFITIPNPIDGEYKILTQGTDTGNYRIEAIDISQNDNDEVSEQTISFEGETITDGKGEHSLEIKNGVELKIQADDESDNDDSNDGDISINITNTESDSIIADNEQENDGDNDGNTIIENDDNLSNNSSDKKHKKHKKKSKHKKAKNKLALANTGTENNSNSNNDKNIKNQEDKNKNTNKNLSKENNQNNSVMGEETKRGNDNSNSEKQNNDKNSNKSFYAFGAVVLLGIILAIGNLFGWLKIKKNKKEADEL